MSQNSHIFGLNKYPNNTDARDEANLLLASADGLTCAAHFTARQIATNNANSLTATTSVNCHEISAFYVQHLLKPATRTAMPPPPDIYAFGEAPTLFAFYGAPRNAFQLLRHKVWRSLEICTKRQKTKQQKQEEQEEQQPQVH